MRSLEWREEEARQRGGSGGEGRRVRGRRGEEMREMRELCEMSGRQSQEGRIWDDEGGRRRREEEKRAEKGLRGGWMVRGGEESCEWRSRTEDKEEKGG